MLQYVNAQSKGVSNLTCQTLGVTSWDENKRAGAKGKQSLLGQEASSEVPRGITVIVLKMGWGKVGLQ